MDLKARTWVARGLQTGFRGVSRKARRTRSACTSEVDRRGLEALTSAVHLDPHLPASSETRHALRRNVRCLKTKRGPDPSRERKSTTSLSLALCVLEKTRRLYALLPGEHTGDVDSRTGTEPATET